MNDLPAHPSAQHADRPPAGWRPEVPTHDDGQRGHGPVDDGFHVARLTIVVLVGLVLVLLVLAVLWSG